ncbi:hypothetical protein NCS55_00469600 [Fusarium keratoplasticum]|nr:hypothetical protein NCS55_00469600 [Fusarium keratoplasticum]
MSSRPLTSRDTFASPGLQDEEVQQKSYPSGLKFAAIMVAICLSFTLVGLDSNIIATAVPAMTRHFGTINDIACRLMSGSFQPMFGKLYTLFPAKILILASLATFIAGTLLCALAPSSPVFILGRAITGFATAAVISGAFAMVIHITPLRKRSTYAGIGAATEAAASLTAPLLGGLLTDRLSWRWCFFIELPLIAGACIIVLFFLDLTKGKHVDGQTFTSVLRELDVLGTAIFVPAIASLLLALQWGGNKYEWSSWRVILLLCIFAALLAVFVWHQSRLGERATVPSRVLRQRNVLFGFVFSCCNNGSLSVIEYYMPSYFQTVKGLSASMSGVMVLPSAAGLVASVPLAGLITPPATGLLSTLNAGSKLWGLIFYQALLGFGAGIGFQGPQVAVQAVFSDSDSQIGIATIQLAQAIGPAIAVAGAQTIFTSKLGSYLARFASELDLADLANQGLTIPDGLSPWEHEQVVSSYSHALNDTFYLPVALACLTIIGALGVEWRLTNKYGRDSKQQSSGWTELWDTDQSDLWDRGKPSPALIEFIESKPQVLSNISNKYRPKALVPGCGKGYDVVALALHGFDTYGLEVSEKGAVTARRYAASELAEPSEYNYHDLDTWPVVDAEDVTIIVGDFFQKGWEPHGFNGFDLIYDYTFLCALHPSLRQAWARRMHELVSPGGVLICLEFPLYKELTLLGPPWGLKGIYWNLLAVGGDGIINKPGEEEANTEGPFQRVLYFKPPISYENGKGTDMISVWSALPWRFPDSTDGRGQG